jgi:multicomponent Na+:H+ antiporter subunit F
MAYTVAAGVEIVTSLLLLVRVARGPSVTDRLVALNAMSAQSALAIVLFAAAAARPIYLDVGFWFASFSYVGAVVWSRFLDRELL